MQKDRYSLEEARQLLGISKSGLEKWLLRARLEPTRDKDDMRLRWLSRAQIEQLAAAHHRQFQELEHVPDMQALDSALSERLDAIERRLDAVERARMPRSAPKPPPDASLWGDDDASATTDAVGGLPVSAWPSVSEFAESVGYNARTARGQAKEGIIASTLIGRERRLSPEQQEAARRHWGM
jgi:hypothetical protein